jgi:hypothetical protein
MFVRRIGLYWVVEGALTNECIVSEKVLVGRKVANLRVFELLSVKIIFEVVFDSSAIHSVSVL